MIRSKKSKKYYLMFSLFLVSYLRSRGSLFWKEPSTELLVNLVLLLRHSTTAW